MTRPIPISLTLPRGSGSVFTAGTQLHYPVNWKRNSSTDCHSELMLFRKG